jgi:hypothetical protein
MTKDQQIRKALALLAPPPRQRAECQRDIEAAVTCAKSARVCSSFSLIEPDRGGDFVRLPAQRRDGSDFGHGRNRRRGVIAGAV